jgi:RNA polymerase sigma-70 factor (ECF subfamily)
MSGHPEGMRQAPSLALGTREPRALGAKDEPLVVESEGGTSQGQGAPTSGKAGTTLVFAEVYELHFDFVWRSARRLGVPVQNLDDVVQDVFVTVYRRLGEFEGRSQLKTWIFGVLRHTVRDLRRSARRKPTEALSEEPSDARTSPHDQAVHGESARLLMRLLETLDQDLREVFVLAELEQMSAPEIASALDVNVNTVYSRLRSARQEFESALKRAQSRDGWRMR